jgi:hypothetical protein
LSPLTEMEAFVSGARAQHIFGHSASEALGCSLSLSDFGNVTGLGLATQWRLVKARYVDIDALSVPA